MIVMSPMAPDNQCPEFLRITFVSRASASYDNHLYAMGKSSRIVEECKSDREKRMASEAYKRNKIYQKKYKDNRKDKIKADNAARYKIRKANAKEQAQGASRASAKLLGDR